MNVQTKYQIKKDGKWVATTGALALSPELTVASFDTLEEVTIFLAASGSAGDYDIAIISQVTE